MIDWVIFSLQFGLMEIINHEEAMTILARTIETMDLPTMLEAVRLVAAICLVPPDGYDCHTFILILIKQLKMALSLFWFGLV